MPPSANTSPTVRAVLRMPPALAREERVGVAAEFLRVSPYRCVPVLAQGQLLGLITEASLTAFLLDAPDTPDERRHWLEARVEQVLVPVVAALTPELSLRELVQALDFHRCDALPVRDAQGNYLGMVGRVDLVRELLCPMALPTLGGMATPIGVYLTTGAVSAGASHAALVLTGLCFFGVQTTLLIALAVLGDLLPPLPLPTLVRESLELLLTASFTLFGFLGFIRLSPLAGYHAAEHQVVHAIERHAPLLPDVVRFMPRVHPRCGTNLAAAVFLLGLGAVLLPLLGKLAYVASGLLAIAYWRSLGAWFQEHLTTRPATDAQLAQGIAAAKTLLSRHDAAPYAPLHPLKRLWYSGLPQILLGFLLGVGLLALLALLIAPLGAALRPHWGELLEL